MIATALAAGLLVLSMFVVEAKKDIGRSRVDDEQQPLLRDSEGQSRIQGSEEVEHISMKELFRSNDQEVRRGRESSTPYGRRQAFV